MHFLGDRKWISKFLLLAVSFCLVTHSTLFCPLKSTVNVQAKEKIGEFLKKREKSKFWKWFYKKYLESPEAFEEWVIMVPSIMGIAALGGAGYGIYKHLPSGFFPNLKQKVDKILHKENNDINKLNNISRRDFINKMMPDKENNFWQTIKDKDNIDGLYWVVCNNECPENRELMQERLQSINSEYEQKMKGTGWGSFGRLCPRVSNSLQVFKDEVCQLKIVYEIFYKNLNKSEKGELNILIKKWMEDLENKKKNNKKLNEFELDKVREFIYNNVGESVSEGENNE